MRQDLIDSPTNHHVPAQEDRDEHLGSMLHLTFELETAPAQENTHLLDEAGVFDDRSSSYPCSPRSEA